jgi:hypothetical protein
MQCCRSSRYAITVGQKPHLGSQLSRLNDWQVLDILRNSIKEMMRGYVRRNRSSIMQFSTSFLIGDVSPGRQDITGWDEVAYNSDKLRPGISVEPLFLVMPYSIPVTIPLEISPRKGIAKSISTS